MYSKKKMEKYRYNRECIMTRIIATYIDNTNYKRDIHWHIHGHTIRLYRLLSLWP